MAASDKVGIVLELEEYEAKLVSFALTRLVNDGYHLYSHKLRKDTEGTIEDANKILADTKIADRIAAELQRKLK